MIAAETLPAYQYFMYPLLSVLARHPEGLRRSDAVDDVADFMALSEAQRVARHNRGPPIPENRIDWAKTRLINLGYVRVEQRGLWEITDAGRVLLQAHPNGFDEATVQDLHERSATKTTRKNTSALEHEFPWIPFYMEFADKLLEYRTDRQPLINLIQELIATSQAPLSMTDRYEPDAENAPLTDVDPFTIFSTFNRGITTENRRTLTTAWGKLLKIKADIPESFRGIPVTHNQNSWFMLYAFRRGKDDIEQLWSLFHAAIDYGDNGVVGDFEVHYDACSAMHSMGWKLTFGLYWIRPHHFIALDRFTRDYIQDVLGPRIPLDAISNRPTGREYLQLCDTLLAYFEREDALVHSFVELSAAAYDYSSFDDDDCEDEDFSSSLPPSKAEVGEQAEAYSLDDILADGCFLEKEALETIFRRLETKKNIILQGPLGTGKTWLGRRLAYALIGSKIKENLHAVQFHPNLSYEDFVRGYRPSGDGKLEVIDGPLMRAVEAAIKEPHAKHVVLIEEFNRGNPAQIFGEMLTLIENTQRAPEHALQLTYSHSGDAPVYVPPNLYLIGTMNIADRSLALVDFALRRRFAFVDMYPMFNDKWKQWVQTHGGMSPEFARHVQQQMTQLNSALSNSVGLGKQFQVGHSYVTPHNNQQIGNVNAWFRDVIETEIGPLLHEYWFDNPAKAEEETARLLMGLG